MLTFLSTLFFLALGLFTLMLVCFFTVTQQTVAVVERWGKFNRLSRAGLHLRIPVMETVTGRVSLRVQQLDVRVETKTRDNVFVDVRISVQFFVKPEKIYEAFYLLEDPATQITAYVYDVVRAQVPKLLVDEVFERKDDIASALKSELDVIMDSFGYGIVKALVTDIDPDAKVKIAMNEINAAQRMRVAAEEKGEADRILKVKAAEADAQSKALQGKGIADQRREIVHGLRDSVDEFQRGIPGSSAQDVMNLILMTQYFDTLKDIGHASKTNAILIPHSPGAITDIAQQIQNATIVGTQFNRTADDGSTRPA